LISQQLHTPLGTPQQDKHTSTPHPEPLREHMIRAMRRRGIKQKGHALSEYNHVITLAPHPLLGQR